MEICVFFKIRGTANTSAVKSLKYYVIHYQHYLLSEANLCFMLYKLNYRLTYHIEVKVNSQIVLRNRCCRFLIHFSKPE